jgi:hypothetical protein
MALNKGYSQFLKGEKPQKTLEGRDDFELPAKSLY